MADIGSSSGRPGPRRRSSNPAAPRVIDRAALRVIGIPWPGIHPCNHESFVRCLSFDDGSVYRRIFSTSRRERPSREVEIEWDERGAPVRTRLRTDEEYAAALALHSRELASGVVAEIGEQIPTGTFATASGARAEGYFRERWHWSSWTT